LREEKGPPQVAWRREEAGLTLEGEPVLSYVLSWPEVENGGFGGGRITAYYRRLARSWRERWRKEIYWKACLELAERRAAARPFTPWSGKLEGEVTLWEGGLLSLRFSGEETRGDGGKPCRVRWGDTWSVPEGTPCAARALFGGRRGWRKALLNRVRADGEQRRAAGDLFLDPDWERRAARYLRPEEACLTPEGAEVYLPQGSVAPAAEGVLTFPVPAAGSGNTVKTGPAG